MTQPAHISRHITHPACTTTAHSPAEVHNDAGASGRLHVRVYVVHFKCVALGRAALGGAAVALGSAALGGWAVTA
jgi:hypothetical protein